MKFALQKLLDDRSISQRQFSTLTDMRYATINSMCNNTLKLLPIDHVDKICSVLECEIDDLIKLEKEQLD